MDSKLPVLGAEDMTGKAILDTPKPRSRTEAANASTGAIIIAAVFLAVAYMWRNEVNAVLRSIERY